MASSRPLTVFCHFYNEEFLLPYWLRHHRRLFDHGVLVDRRSSDRSVEIVRELTPGWEVVPSRNPIFDARDCDLEMMHHERLHDGWKVVLNVSEFVFHDDLGRVVDSFEQAHPSTPAIGIPVAVMIDRAEDRDAPVGDEDLFLQRFHGVFPDLTASTALRYLHRSDDGRYAAGRHGTALPYLVSDDLLLLRFSWSPYGRIRARKLQIGAAIPESDVRQGLSWHHLATAEELDAQYLAFAGVAHDLRSHERYRAVLDRLRTHGASRAPVAVPSRRATPVTRRRVAILSPDVTRAQQFADALGPTHDVRMVPVTDPGAGADADVLIVDHRIVVAHRQLLGGHAALVVDLAGSEPASDGAADAVSPAWHSYMNPTAPLGHSAVLLKGDLFLCATLLVRGLWAAHLDALGRVPIGPDGCPVLRDLLEVAPGCDALVRFCHEPRRVTGRLAVTDTMIASKDAYRQVFTQSVIALGSAHVLRDAYGRLETENRRIVTEYRSLERAYLELEAELRRIETQARSSRLAAVPGRSAWTRWRHNR